MQEFLASRGSPVALPNMHGYRRTTRLARQKKAGISDMA